MGPKKGKDKGKPTSAAAAAMMKQTGPPPKPKKIPPPPAIFTNDDIMRFKEMFKAHDEDNVDKVSIKAIPLMLRKLGFNPKTSEINQLYQMFLEDDLVDTVELHEWYFMIEAKMTWGDDFEQVIVKAMATLGHDDEETGLTELDVIRVELFNWGEPFQDIEFVDWIKIAIKDKTYNVEDGSFNYPKFIDNMNNKDVRYIKEPINFFKLDQKTLAEMAMKKALEEKSEEDRKEGERRVREEARRQKLIADGLLPPD